MVLMPLPEISSERLLVEVDELLRSVPPGNTLDMNHPDLVRWSGKAKAVVNAWNKGEGEMFQRHLQHFMGEFAAIDGSDRYGVLSILQQAHFDLKMRTAGPTSIPIAQGNVFEYFDEARKIIQLATTEAFFVDPYLDAEFASRYLTLVHATTSIRLLTSQSPKWLLTLVPAVKMLSAQTSHAISVSIYTIGPPRQMVVY
jgi:hypothetical protein